MKRNICQASAAFLVLFASGCQTGLPTELIVDQTVDDTLASVPASRVPPLSGGTLLVTRDTKTAVVSDPERDRLLRVRVDGNDLAEIQLEPGDEPGRLVEGPPGTVFVALRGGDGVVAVDVSSATITGRSPVCAAPRGLAYDSDSENPRLLVACASGDLVTLDPATLSETQRLFLGPDLRDVIVRDDDVLVTHFRAATVTVIDAEGVAQTPLAPSVRANNGELQRVPHVAWRTSVASDGTVVMLHQMNRVTEMQLGESETGADENGEPAYGGDGECDREPVHAAITLFDRDELWSVSTGQHATPGMHLSIDLAIAPDGRHAVVVDPSARQLRRVLLVGGGTNCVQADDSTNQVGPFEGTPVAVAYAGEQVVLQTREPATLQVFADGEARRTIWLGGESQADTGFDLFHNTTEPSNESGMACASCHPEGRDDGHVWNFSGEGRRRTQSLAGTLAGTAPFHWGGNLPTLRSLMSEVSTRRMGGTEQSPARIAALESWLLALKPLRVAAPDPVVDQETVDRGQALFEDETVGCAACHSGPSFTNNKNESVGLEAALQVPSLIGISTRAPFMHDGCADTLMDRFTPVCGGDQHGDTSGLDVADLEALVAYMNTL